MAVVASFAIPAAILTGLALFCLWKAIQAWREPRQPYRKGNFHRAIIGNTMASKTTEDGRTIILCGRRPQTEPEPDGFIE